MRKWWEVWGGGLRWNGTRTRAMDALTRRKRWNKWTTLGNLGCDQLVSISHIISTNLWNTWCTHIKCSCSPFLGSFRSRDLVSCFVCAFIWCSLHLVLWGSCLLRLSLSPCVLWFHVSASHDVVACWCLFTISCALILTIVFSSSFQCIFGFSWF